MLILDITRTAKNTGQKKRLRTLKDLDRAALLLARACSLLLDYRADDAELRQAIFSSVPKSRLTESVSKVNELARPQNNNGLVRIHLNTQEYQHQLLAQLSETPERKQHA